MNGRGNNMREVTVTGIDTIMYHIAFDKNLVVLPTNISGVGSDGFLVTRVDVDKDKGFHGYLDEERIKSAVECAVEKARCINAVSPDNKYVCSISCDSGGVYVSLAEHIYDERKAYFKAGSISSKYKDTVRVINCSDGSFISTEGW